MQITAKTEYAIRAVLHLAENHDVDGWMMAREIAKEQNIPPKFLPQILHTLKQANVLRASRGAKGGFRLSKVPADLTVGEVVEAIEGPVLTKPCDKDLSCEMKPTCPICGLWSEAHDSMLEVLHGTSVWDLVERKRSAQQNLGHAMSTINPIGSYRLRPFTKVVNLQQSLRAQRKRRRSYRIAALAHELLDRHLAERTAAVRPPQHP